jgi:hypothetical protein
MSYISQKPNVELREIGTPTSVVPVHRELTHELKIVLAFWSAICVQ